MREPGLKRETCFKFPIYTLADEPWRYVTRAKEPLQPFIKLLKGIPKSGVTRYVGHYFGGKNLKIYRVAKAEFYYPHDVSTWPLAQIEKKEKAWDIFFQHATIGTLCVQMENIFPETTKDEIYDMYGSFEEGFNHLYRKRRDADISKGEKLLNGFFKKLRDKPTAIYDSTLREYFITVWLKARYSTNKKEAHLMRKLLQIAFPKPDQHKGREIPIPRDERVLLAYDLMRKLTLDLQKRCKAIFKKWGYENEEDFTSLVKSKDEYAEFQNECTDDRLGRLDPKMIRRLFLSPVEGFLDPQIANYFNCSPDRFKKHLLKIGK